MKLDEYWLQIKEGNEKALEQLFKETYENLRKYALYLTENILLAEEIVQDVYLKIWQSRKKINVKGSFRAYLYRTVHNYAINGILSQNTRKSSVHKIYSGDNYIELTEKLDFDDYIIEKIEAKETEAAIMQTVHNLPDQCRIIFELSRFTNKSNKEIAIQLKISENTVKTQIYRALNKIKESIVEKS